MKNWNSFRLLCIMTVATSVALHCDTSTIDPSVTTQIVDEITRLTNDEWKAFSANIVSPITMAKNALAASYKTIRDTAHKQARPIIEKFNEAYSNELKDQGLGGFSAWWDNLFGDTPDNFHPSKAPFSRFTGIIPSSIATDLSNGNQIMEEASKKLAFNQEAQKLVESFKNTLQSVQTMLSGKSFVSEANPVNKLEMGRSAARMVTNGYVALQEGLKKIYPQESDVQKFLKDHGFNVDENLLTKFKAQFPEEDKSWKTITLQLLKEKLWNPCTALLSHPANVINAWSKTCHKSDWTSIAAQIGIGGGSVTVSLMAAYITFYAMNPGPAPAAAPAPAAVPGLMQNIRNMIRWCRNAAKWPAALTTFIVTLGICWKLSQQIDTDKNMPYDIFDPKVITCSTQPASPLTA